MARSARAYARVSVWARARRCPPVPRPARKVWLLLSKRTRSPSARFLLATCTSESTKITVEKMAHLYLGMWKIRVGAEEVRENFNCDLVGFGMVDKIVRALRGGRNGKTTVQENLRHLCKRAISVRSRKRRRSTPQIRCDILLSSEIPWENGPFILLFITVGETFTFHSENTTRGRRARAEALHFCAARIIAHHGCTLS